MKHDVIGVDEGQFYPDLLEVVQRLADAGKKVIVSALDGDFRRKPFGDVLQLVPLADSVVSCSRVFAFQGLPFSHSSV